MPRYFYRAKNLQGKEEQGVIEAQGRRHLAELLKQKGYFLLSIEGDGEEAAVQKKKKTNLKIEFKFFEKIFGVSLSEKLFFTKNLSVMIKTGVRLPRAFQILSKQTKSSSLREALKSISEEVIRGQGLSQALARFPKIFSQLYRETLKVGEETGKIEESLHILADQMDREHQLKAKIKTAMVYPLVVVCMALIIGLFMFIFAVPRLKEAFEGLNVQLPIITRAVLGLADFLRFHWIFAILLFGFFIFLLIIALRTKKGGKVKSFVFLKAPILAKIVKKTNSALALRIISSLLKAGVPIVKTLEVTAGALTNYYFQESLNQAAEMVKKGKKISQAFQPYEHLYSTMVLQMMEVGEETGETSGILEKLAEFYEAEVAESSAKLSSVVEPILILLIGGAVGFFAVAMMQPMFSIMSGIQ